MSLRLSTSLVVVGALLLTALADIVLLPWLPAQVPHLAAQLVTHLVVALGAALAVYWLWRQASSGLQTLSAQAEDLGQGRFTMRRQPAVVEWQPLAKALNVAAQRLQEVAEERERRLGALREHIDIDPVTGLGSRVHFESQLDQALARLGPGQSGALALLRVDDLVGLNRRFGRERADDLLRAVGALLRLRLVTLHGQAMAARLGGAEFAVLAPESDAGDFGRWLANLARALDQMRVELLTDRGRTAWLGGTTFAAGEEAEQVKTRADAMLQVCEQSGVPWKLTTAEHPLHSVPVNTWRLLVDSALAGGRVSLKTFEVLAQDFQVLHREAVVRLQLSDGRLLHGEDVVPPATRTGRTAELDLRMVSLAIEGLAGDGVPVAVNISPLSVGRPAFLSRLAALLDAAGPLAALLALEVDESILQDGREDLRRLSDVLARHGTRLGLDHFHDRIGALPGLGQLRIHYVKLDGRRLDGVGEPGGARRFVEICRSLCRAEGIQLIACGVDDERRLRHACDLGFAGYTGKAVRAGLPQVVSAPVA